MLYFSTDDAVNIVLCWTNNGRLEWYWKLGFRFKKLGTLFWVTADKIVFDTEIIRIVRISDVKFDNSFVPSPHELTMIHRSQHTQVNNWLFIRILYQPQRRNRSGSKFFVRAPNRDQNEDMGVEKNVGILDRSMGYTNSCAIESIEFIVPKFLVPKLLRHTSLTLTSPSL